MSVKKKITMHIDRSYKITSKKLKEALDIEGEIVSMNLYSGRSPNDIAEGVSPDKDKWEITTTEDKEFVLPCEEVKDEKKN